MADGTHQARAVAKTGELAALARETLWHTAAAILHRLSRRAAVRADRATADVCWHRSGGTR